HPHTALPSLTPPHSLHLSSPHTSRPQLYTLSLHDALPIYSSPPRVAGSPPGRPAPRALRENRSPSNGRRSRSTAQPARIKTDSSDRKSTRLNSSHGSISYAVFCLKKKKNTTHIVNTYEYDT